MASRQVRETKVPDWVPWNQCRAATLNEVFLFLVKYLTDAEIQELLAQNECELSDIDDPDFENIPECDTDSEHLENENILTSEEIEQPSKSKSGQKRKRIRTKWDNSE
ncbi:hypothetical protein NPIL_618101 [Nephila pilipes]|uniref:Uncharacterized protein n=1 Tax=Nephila pilipes TaxID=299642 RepID=A0A8X6MUG9_NEPPI|nr:hypothetical protein NPIL_618101 [Nephila pilipes]